MSSGPLPFAHQEQVKLSKEFEHGDIEAHNDQTWAFNVVRTPLPFALYEQGKLSKEFEHGDIEAQNEETPAFNVFKDPCPSLTKSRSSSRRSSSTET